MRATALFAPKIHMNLFELEQIALFLKWIQRKM